jgi:hypothetical protein
MDLFKTSCASLADDDLKTGAGGLAHRAWRRRRGGEIQEEEEEDFYMSQSANKRR